MEDAGLVAAAAICREKAKEWPAARALWSRLAHVTERGDDAYVAALVRFNLARCAKQCGDPRQAREAMVASVRLLEEAADHFESIGQRERAFDCFQRAGADRARERRLRGRARGVRQLHPHPARGPPQVLRARVLRGGHRRRGRARGDEPRRRRSPARRPTTRGRWGWRRRRAGTSMRQAELWRAVGAAAPGPPRAARDRRECPAGVGPGVRRGRASAGASGRSTASWRRSTWTRRAASTTRAWPAATPAVEDDALETTSALAHPLRQDSHFTEVWHVDVSSGSSRAAPPRRAPTCCSTSAGRISSAERRCSPASRPCPLESAPDDTSAAATRARAAAGRAAGAAAAVRGAVAAREAARAAGAAREGRGAAGDADALLQAQLRHGARGLRDPDPAVVEQATQGRRGAVLPARGRPAVAHRPRVGRAGGARRGLRALARIDSPRRPSSSRRARARRAGRSAGGPGRAQVGARGEVRRARRGSLQGAKDPLRGSLREVLAARGLAA